MKQNKKALYESIMNKVALQVKKALNEELESQYLEVVNAIVNSEEDNYGEPEDEGIITFSGYTDLEQENYFEVKFIYDTNSIYTPGKVSYNYDQPDDPDEFDIDVKLDKVEVYLNNEQILPINKEEYKQGEYLLINRFSEWSDIAQETEEANDSNYENAKDAYDYPDYDEA